MRWSSSDDVAWHVLDGTICGTHRPPLPVFVRTNETTVQLPTEYCFRSQPFSMQA